MSEQDQNTFIQPILLCEKGWQIPRTTKKRMERAGYIVLIVDDITKHKIIYPPLPINTDAVIAAMIEVFLENSYGSHWEKLGKLMLKKSKFMYQAKP